LFTTGIDDFAAAALLRSYQKDARLLATVNQIGRQMRTTSRLNIKYFERS
jgi:hypothetical protein